MSGAEAFASWVSQEARERFRDVLAEGPPPAELVAIRAHYDAFNRRCLDVARKRHAVAVVEEVCGGVPVHLVSPEGGARDAGTLICLHGGAFMWGSGAGALLEAVPVAAATGRQVVAVDYRLAPEDPFPAAVDDVVAVFDKLCERHDPAAIGIYGCSAGAMLTAQVTGRLIADGVSLPGAIAMLHGAGLDFEGDSVHAASLFDPRVEPGSIPTAATLPYFASADLADPLVLPGNHLATLARFPPSLLVTATRDFAASSCATMHRRLLSVGVEAQLVVFDGLSHAHHMAVDLPESRETFALLARFFDRRLARP